MDLSGPQSSVYIPQSSVYIPQSFVYIPQSSVYIPSLLCTFVSLVYKFVSLVCTFPVFCVHSTVFCVHSSGAVAFSAVLSPPPYLTPNMGFSAKRGEVRNQLTSSSRVDSATTGRPPSSSSSYLATKLLPPYGLATHSNFTVRVCWLASGLG